VRGRRVLVGEFSSWQHHFCSMTAQAEARRRYVDEYKPSGNSLISTRYSLEFPSSENFKN
jgi:hypothetical protein